MNDQSIEPSIANEHIAAAAENEQVQMLGFGELECFVKLRRIGNFNKIARRAADLEGRERFERVVLCDGKQLGEIGCYLAKPTKSAKSRFSDTWKRFSK